MSEYKAVCNCGSSIETTDYSAFNRWRIDHDGDHAKAIAIAREKK